MKKLTLVAMLALGMIFTACGGETSTVDGDGGSDGYETTEYTDGDSGGDVVETESVDEGVTETADGDSTEVEVEVTNPCIDGYVALYIDDVMECVEESFAQVVTDIDGMVFVREVDDKEFAIAVRHISFADFDTDVCPDSTYFITNLQPMNTVCLEDDLSLSLCKNDASLCGEIQISEGNIFWDSSDNKYYVNYTQCWNEGTECSLAEYYEQ